MKLLTLGLIACSLSLSAAACHALEPTAIIAADPFTIKPYLQMGQETRPQGDVTLALLWAAPSAGDWGVEVRLGSGGWTKSTVAAPSRVAVGGVDEHWMYRAELVAQAGEPFDYRVTREGTTVFESKARAFNKQSDTLHAVIFGDCARGTPEQRRIAYQASRFDPDFVVIPGDIVYGKGRLSEYLEHYFPVYNADAASPEAGGPLIRSSVFIGACGNHDLFHADLNKQPDAFAYYWLWSMPRNGPSLKDGNSPLFAGEPEANAATTAAVGPGYPDATNFSFDAGITHWTFLDSNTYVDWRDPSLRNWLAADLKAASKATWRFVVFHHPPFHSSDAHKDAQRMRELSPLFEAGGVDMVICGHVHNYQRSKPLRFAPKGPLAAPAPRNAQGEVTTSTVDGAFTFDNAFDGKTRTKPHGIIYLVTGAGGAPLYTEKNDAKPELWKEFTAAYVSGVHSLSVLDIKGPSATIRQIDLNGVELDRFTLTK